MSQSMRLMQPQSQPSGAKDEQVRLSIKLSPSVAKELKGLAKARGTSVTETIRQAIGVLAFMHGARDRGAVINIVEKGETKEIVWL